MNVLASQKIKKTMIVNKKEELCQSALLKVDLSVLRSIIIKVHSL